MHTALYITHRSLHLIVTKMLVRTATISKGEYPFVHIAQQVVGYSYTPVRERDLDLDLGSGSDPDSSSARSSEWNRIVQSPGKSKYEKGT